jgi:hypothetical protein
MAWHDSYLLFRMEFLTASVYRFYYLASQKTLQKKIESVPSMPVTTIVIDT